jgi:hypothetical protein
VAWSLLRKVDPIRFVTHRYPFDRAAEAYAALDRDPGDCVQVILTYGEGCRTAGPLRPADGRPPWAIS